MGISTLQVNPIVYYYFTSGTSSWFCTIKVDETNF